MPSGWFRSVSRAIREPVPVPMRLTWSIPSACPQVGHVSGALGQVVGAEVHAVGDQPVVTLADALEECWFARPGRTDATRATSVLWTAPPRRSGSARTARFRAGRAGTPGDVSGLPSARGRRSRGRLPSSPPTTTIGSGLDSGGSIRTTNNLICAPSELSRRSGTVRYPQLTSSRMTAVTSLGHGDSLNGRMAGGLAPRTAGGAHRQQDGQRHEPPAGHQSIFANGAVS